MIVSDYQELWSVLLELQDHGNGSRNLIEN
jgi:hypothetical protein